MSGIHEGRPLLPIPPVEEVVAAYLAIDHQQHTYPDEPTVELRTEGEILDSGLLAEQLTFTTVGLELLLDKTIARDGDEAFDTMPYITDYGQFKVFLESVTSDDIDSSPVLAEILSKVARVTYRVVSEGCMYLDPRVAAEQTPDILEYITKMRSDGEDMLSYFRNFLAIRYQELGLDVADYYERDEFSRLLDMAARWAPEFPDQDTLPEYTLVDAIEALRDPEDQTPGIGPRYWSEDGQPQLWGEVVRFLMEFESQERTQVLATELRMGLLASIEHILENMRTDLASMGRIDDEAFEVLSNLMNVRYCLLDDEHLESAFFDPEKFSAFTEPIAED